MKRIVCFLLTLVMLLGMIPMTAINANAAGSNLSTSNAAINGILSKPDRFQAKAYGDGYIGYGTKVAADDAAANAKYPNGISEDDALDLLKDYLEDTVDKAINTFTKNNNINLTQQQHDALAVYCMDVKDTSWLSNSANTLREAVRTGKTGQAFLNAIAHTYTGKIANTELFKGQMNRLFSVANLYLNANYAYLCPSNYTFVVLEYADKKTTDVIAYDSNSPMTLSVVDDTTNNKSDFLGWYKKDDLDKDGNFQSNAVTKLNASTSHKTLVSKFSSDTTFKYEINSNSLGSRYVFAAAYTKAQYATNMSDKALEQLDKDGKKLKSNSAFKVTEEKMVDGVKWLRGTGKNGSNKDVTGWVYLGELPGADVSVDKVVATATITAAKAPIHEGATADSTTRGEINKGVTVNIYEIKTEATATGNKKWGKVSVNGQIGWINLANAEVKDVSNRNDAADGRKGTIVNADDVNIREDAGLQFTKLTSLKRGTKVTVLETKNVNGAQWGYVEWDGLRDGYTKGWIYMYYVNVEGLEQGAASGETGIAKYTGVVISNINLNVRKHADVYSTKVGELTKGTEVKVYEIKTKNGMKWGRIGTDRWVCTSFLDLKEVPGSSSNGTLTTTTLQATVSVNTLDILKNYNSNAAKIGSLKKGDVLTILERNTETTETGSRIWGRITKDGVEGWINLAYVELKTVTSVSGTTSGTTGGVVSNSNGAAGVVSNCISVNIREGAGCSQTQITKLNNGTAVKVYERVTKDNAPWARITWESNGTTREGWVCMTYVTMAAAGTTPNVNGGTVGGTSSNTISATGTVNSNINLRVRSGAGLGYAEIDSLSKGTKVTIYEQVTNDGMIWGQIHTAAGTGWICMSYVTVDNTSTTGKGVMGTIARCFKAVNVRSAPGTGNALVGTIGVGKRVEVFETRQHGNTMWARVAQGWISMDYVILDTELPPGTALDATQPTTEATKATDPEATINRDNEVLYTISGTVNNAGNALNVYNDTSEKSDKIGTVNNQLPLNILAVKNNGAELWGRIDQYATAGWVNMKSVSYSVTGYINTDEQPVYADPDTASTVKGKLNINTPVTITKLNADTETVYGWYESQTTNVAGWVPMGRISKDETKVIPTYRSSLDQHANSQYNLVGTTNADITAYNEANGKEAKFYMTSGVTVYFNEIDLEYGRVWGHVVANGVDAWIDMGSVTYTLPQCAGMQDLNVRKEKVVTDDTDPQKSNILGVVKAGQFIDICELSFDASGNLWGKLRSADAVLNGGYVMMKDVSTGNFSIENR